MASLSIPRRPPFYGQLSSSSLQGMERSSSEKSPLTESYRDKPLPPAPKKRSSVHSLHPEDIIDDYARRQPEDKLLPPHAFHPRNTYSSGRNKNAQMRRLQSDLEHDYRIQSASDTSTSSGNHRQSKRRAEKSTQAPLNTATDAADVLAKEYRAAFGARSIAIPEYQSLQYRAEHEHPPTPLSARITDVIDHSLMPSPLRVSQTSGSERSSSRFSSSSSSSGMDSTSHHIRDSFRAFTWRARNVRRASAEDVDKKKIMSTASAKYPQMKFDSIKRSRLSSVASQGSASIQQGLSNMYDTLTSLSVGSSKSKPTIDVASSQKNGIPRERRSPAIPITPYQHLGRKAWETPKSPKQKSPKKMFLFLPRSQSNATRSSRSTEKGSIRRSRSEKRREELKKKIVVVGATDPYSVGRVSHWL